MTVRDPERHPDETGRSRVVAPGEVVELEQVHVEVAARAGHLLQPLELAAEVGELVGWRLSLELLGVLADFAQRGIEGPLVGNLEVRLVGQASGRMGRALWSGR